MASLRPQSAFFAWRCRISVALAALLICTHSGLAEEQVVSRFNKEIQPLLVQYCYDCHGEGADKGGLSFDKPATVEALVGDKELWWKVLQNVQAGVMPPPKKKERPTPEERERLEHWIKYGAFGIDPQNPDPGRVTLRRLNRVEYRNTIRDLMGVDYKTEEEFPPDDTGYGFDNIGDVLTVSPLLLEKYMQAAETIIAEAVPTTSRVVRETSIPGNQFKKQLISQQQDAEAVKPGEKKEERRQDLFLWSFYEKASADRTHKVDEAGTYQVTINLSVRGEFDFDPGRCRFIFKIDGKEVWSNEFAWQDGKPLHHTFDQKWEPGERTFSFELEPLEPPDKRKNALDMRILSVQVRGPMEKQKWIRPKNFDRFFGEDPPTDPVQRRAYTRQVLQRFTVKAFRRPVDDRTIDRLVAIAEGHYSQPGGNVQEGIGRAMLAVLASPRFIFRLEEDDPASTPGTHPLVDEYALASRLSYFLWSTMPDDQLLSLAAQGELRKNLPIQIKRMLEDRRSAELVENFVGQWLQVRDVEGISIDGRSIIARDTGVDRELQELREQFRALRDKREAEIQKQIAAGKRVDAGRPQRSPEEQKLFERFRKLRDERVVELEEPLRRAMRRETEMYFQYVLREDRSVLELLDSNYTFLNERLAKHYNIPGVNGDEMRRVTLPADSPRGGILTQGTVLVVTSNPTRTSPVKRGLFLLENILGAPTPPPPPDVPELEASEKEFKDKEPTLREVLELHRSNAICTSCHARMDPLGLALEHFNAMGMWRETERKRPIDASGRLITGESFDDIRGLKKILKSERRRDFYRCLTEKMAIYALGRGLEYYDVQTVDLIVDRLEKENGRFSALLNGIIESAPFQRRRAVTAVAQAEDARETHARSRSEP